MTCLFWSELIKCTWFNGLTDYNWGVRAANTTERSPSGWGYDHWWQSLKFWLDQIYQTGRYNFLKGANSKEISLRTDFFVLFCGFFLRFFVNECSCNFLKVFKFELRGKKLREGSSEHRLDVCNLYKVNESH